MTYRGGQIDQLRLGPPRATAAISLAAPRARGTTAPITPAADRRTRPTWCSITSTRRAPITGSVWPPRLRSDEAPLDIRSRPA